MSTVTRKMEIVPTFISSSPNKGHRSSTYRRTEDTKSSVNSKTPPPHTCSQFVV